MILNIKYIIRVKIMHPLFKSTGLLYSDESIFELLLSEDVPLSTNILLISQKKNKVSTSYLYSAV